MMQTVFFGLAVAVVALSASVLIEFATFDSGDKYVQDADGAYNFISAIDFELGSCIHSDNSPCSVIVTPAGVVANVGSQAPFDDAEIATYTSGLNPLLLSYGCNCLFVR